MPTCTQLSRERCVRRMELNRRLARDVTQSPAAPVLFAAAMMLAAIAGLVAFRLAFRSPALA